ncbi:MULTISPECIES: SRPBCC family protein [unclassified Nodularia (in: cyanobacteria)]|uniref:SRPBCC family protein n=1 Tax=unclassified Nodularia (in: cyanobacteria) TaxID=2656917 RepID=UPI0018816B0E|nr:MULTISPECIES: SRPBCC family protein [unclassified Nodularia (in: cyanobacteria)]MBE9198533.1 cyclase [Nodularia sp. LEGE 06071]MCC2693615.1 cyclase [Nodularia sp. LEGE 04288]
MSAFHLSDSIIKGLNMPWSHEKQSSLMQGEILLQTQSHTAWGGSVTACMYLPLLRSQVWQQLTDYPRWVQYFPDVTKSEVLSRGEVKQLYQVAQKTFLFFTVQMEIYLEVVELLGQQIEFRMQKGTFVDFAAILDLKDFGDGTLLAYQVKATPNIPMPSIFIQQAMNFELPANMRKMRQVLCKVQ